MKRFKKLSKKIIFLLSALLVVGVLIAGYLYFFSNSASAAWFNESWLYRQKVALTNSGSNQTDLPVQITLDTQTLEDAGKILSNCNDLRATDVNGKLLPFWIEPTTCSTSATKIWIKANSIPAGGATLYLYYGNPSAPAGWVSTPVPHIFVREISNVKAAWNMDEASWNGTSNEVVDSSGSGIHGTGVNSINTTTGKFDRGGSFNGGAEGGAHYINAGTGAVSTNNTLTVSTWAYRTGDGNVNDGFNALIYAQLGSNPWGLYYIFTVPGSDQLRFGVSTGIVGSPASTEVNINLTTYLPVNTWHMITGTWDGTTASLYVDGAFVDSTTNALTLGSTINSGLYFGTNNSGLNTFKGTLDDMRVYNKTLSATEIADLYGTGGDRQGYVTTNYANKELVRKYSSSVTVGSPGSEEQSPGPVGYWKFDDGQGTTALSSASIGTSYNSGTGADGACSITDGTVTLDAASSNTCAGRATADAVNYNISTSIAAAATTIDVGATPTGIASGDEILIINLRGTSGDNSNVGKFETRYVTVSGNVLTLDSALQNAYDGTTQKIMVQRIPQYTTVTIGDSTGGAGSAVLTTSAYNNTNGEGGVIFFRATGAVTIDTDGKIDGAGKGYAGGTWSGNDGTGGITYNGQGGNGNYGSGSGTGTTGQGGGGGGGATGGTGTVGGAGGGAAWWGGGGGGGGYGTVGSGGYGASNGSGDTGGNGGTGQSGDGGGGGGTYGSADLSKLMFGSGGGGSTNEKVGGAGGGIIFIAGSSITVSGSISTNGGAGQNNNNGASGGGSGGSVSIKAATQTLGSSLVTASGGSGGTGNGNGGNGGVGRIAIVYNSSSGTTSPSANTSTVATLTNGTLAGTTKPTWQPEDRCVAGKCLYFDGSTSNITVETAINDIKTISFWVRPTSVSSSAFIDFDGGTHKVTVSSGTISATGFTSPTIYVNGKVSSTLTANTWQLVTVTTGTSFDSNASLVIGKSFTTYLNGFMDDVKIYNYARSAAQVKTDYNAGAKNASTNSGTSAVLGSSTEAWLSDGLVGYWKLDEASGDATDYSGNGGTLTDNNTVTSNPGKFGTARQFTAASSEYLSRTDNATLSMGDIDFTVSTWVYLDSKTTNRAMVFKYTTSNSTSDYALAYSQSNDRFIFSVSDGSSQGDVLANNFGSPSTGTWYFVTAWHDSKSNRTGISVNGGTPDTLAWTTGVNDGTAPFEIGNYSASGAWGPMDGRIDEVRAYKRLLSQKEITDLYNWAPGPVGYWKMEEGSGTTASDSSSNGKTSSAFTGNVGWTTGKYGKGLSFDGDGDVARFTEASQFDLGATTDSYAISAWMKTTTNYSGNATVAGKDDGSGAYPMELYLNSSEYACFQISDGTNSPSACGSTALNDGKWHYLTGIRDVGNDKIYLYVDGIQITSTTDSTTATAANNDDLSIGNAGTDYVGQDFNGQIDDVKIYNYARTGKQIVSDMNAGHPNVGSPVGSAVAHWKLDEGQGTTANDSTPNANSLTLSAASWTDSGKFGKAWNGTGARWLSKADDADFDFAADDSFAISLWYKTDSANNPGATEYLANKGPVSASAAGYAIYANTSGNLCFAIDDDTTWDPDITSCTSTDVYDNTWHHVLGIRDTVSDKTYIYIDGVLKDSDTDSTSATLANSSTLYIGDSNGADGGDEFNGDIDEIKFYRYASTANEVKTEYNRGSSLVLGTAGNNSSYEKGAANQEYCVPGDSTSCVAPVGRWDFEEGKDNSCSGGTNDVCDTSGSGNDGAWNGTGTKHWDTGKIGKAGKFNGTDDYVNVGTSSPFRQSSAITYSFWVNIPSGGGGYAMGTASSGGQGSGGVSVTTSAITFYWTPTTPEEDRNYSATVSLSPNTWYHISAAINFSGSSSGTIYLNGVPQTTTLSAAVTNGTPRTGYNRDNGDDIGGRYVNTQQYFNGKIDQARIYNYARSAAQVAYDYNRGAPVGHWKLDECQGATAYDSSGNKNNGTITIGATDEATIGTCTTSSTAWGSGATGKRNASLSFDGDDDYVSVTDPTSGVLDFGTGAFSISFWGKTNVSPARAYYAIGKLLNSDTYDGYHIGLSSSGYATFIWRTASTNYAATGTTDVTDNNWHLITGVRNSTGIYVYVDGKQVGSNTDSNTQTSEDNDQPLAIGRERTGASTEHWDGQIDDVRVYNYALTAAQVKDVMNQGAVFFGPSTGSP